MKNPSVHILPRPAKSLAAVAGPPLEWPAAVALSAEEIQSVLILPRPVKSLAAVAGPPLEWPDAVALSAIQSVHILQWEVQSVRVPS